MSALKGVKIIFLPEHDNFANEESINTKDTSFIAFITKTLHIKR